MIGIVDTVGSYPPLQFEHMPRGFNLRFACCHNPADGIGGSSFSQAAENGKTMKL